MDIIYPTFEIVEDRGFIPKIYLPRNYLELVKGFYENGGKAEVEHYVRNLKDMLSQSSFFSGSVRLNWCDKRGLVNISLGMAGLDLNERGLPNFQEHNLGGYNSFIAGSIAMKYASELLMGDSEFV